MFVNSQETHYRIMLAVSSCSVCFVSYFNDDVDSLAHRVGPVCFFRGNCTVEGLTLFQDRPLAVRPGS